MQVIILILIVTVCAIFKKDGANIEIDVIRPWKFSIKIQKDKHYEKDKKDIKKGIVTIRNSISKNEGEVYFEEFLEELIENNRHHHDN